MNKDIIYASCTLIINPINSNEILGVARREDHTLFGLPGGKVEPNESFIDAAIRETMEETGLLVRDLELLISVLDANNVMCTTFLAKIDPEDKIQPATNEAPAKWVTRDVLLSGPFGTYNEIVFKEYDKRYNK